MIKHISMFSFKDSAKGKSKSENIETVRQMLLKIPEKVPYIVSNEVGTNLGMAPAGAGGDMLLFCDLVQIITFKSDKDAMAYPAHPAHIELAGFSGELLKTVAAIDFEC